MVLKVLSWLKVLLVTRQDLRRVDDLISAFTATSRGQLVQGRLSDWLRGAWLRPPAWKAPNLLLLLSEENPEGGTIPELLEALEVDPPACSWNREESRTFRRRHV